MPTPRSRQTARLRARRRRTQRRARQVAVLGFLGVLALVTLLLTAFGSSPPDVVDTPVATTVVSTPRAGRPEPLPLASVGNLQIVMPIAAGAVTGLGYHAGTGGALDLKPAGRQANEGILARLWRRVSGTDGDGPVWYQLGGPGTGAVVVGAAPGTDVYAPVNGTVIGITDHVVGGRKVGSRIEIRPTLAPALVLTVSNVRPDPVLSVGSMVERTSSKVGTAVDVAALEEQALAKHARNDGNNVAISVYPASGNLP
jgi:hypothetical protein